MELLYDYQYNVAAMIVTFVLLFVYLLRRSYFTKSNKLYVSLVVLDFIAALFDYASIFTISNPQEYNIIVLYATALGYLLSYNMMAVMFFDYVDSRAKVNWLKIPNRILCCLASTFITVAVISSPMTHWVAYFDENLNYCHGPLFMTLYIIALAFFVLEAILFFLGRKRFNRYQMLASIVFLLLMVGSVGIQFWFPRALVGQLTMAMILIYVYVAFENPAYLNYRETQCYNRSAFLAVVKDLNKKNIDFSIIAFSIQDYEFVKRGAGLSTIDDLTSRIAEFLHREFKSSAFCLADDKFAIIVGYKENVLPIIGVLNSYFSKPIKLKYSEMQVSISVATIADLSPLFETEDIEELVEYRIQHPDDQTDSKTIIKTSLENKHRHEKLIHIIKRAIAQNEFMVFYQPIYSVETGRFDSCEALIRLNDPELGFINPEELITTAEDGGYIDKIGEQVFRKVCSFINESGICKNGLLKYIEVNLSPLQCTQKRLSTNFISIMQDYRINPSWINLEITETAHMQNESRMFSNINSLGNMGVGFSIDDYGSGFASADYLIKLPVSIVKIDKMILWQAMENSSAMKVLRNTIALIKDLGKHIVVEGVENEAMADILTENGCDYMQGYLYSKPLPRVDFLKFIEEHNVQKPEEKAEDKTAEDAF